MRSAVKNAFAAAPTRRAVLLGSAAVAVASAVSLGSQGEAFSATSYDQYQRYLTLLGIGDGQVLAIQADGALLWHRNKAWSNGTGDWAAGSGRVIGSGWHQYTAVMGSGDGTVYGLRGDGTIVRRRYHVSNLETGVGTWSRSTQIGTGWGHYVEVVGYGGDFYGRASDGSVYWSHYDASLARWTALHHRLTGFDFKGHSLYADADGVLYSYSKDMYWYRQVKGVWQSGSGARIHASIGDLSIQGLFCTGSGATYYLRPDMPGATPEGQLLMQRLRNFTTAGHTPSWANGGKPTLVGVEWWLEPWAALQGYPITRSVVSGQDVRIAVSTTFPTFGWELVKVGGDNPVPVSPPQSGTATGQIQMLPGSDYLRSGCAWKPTLRVPTTGLAAGLYAVRLQGPHGLTRHVPFIVKPQLAKKARIAFLIPTLTHHAYNAWGGHSQYCHDLDGQQRFLNLNRPSRSKAVSATGRHDHTLYNDIMLLRWMNQQGYAVDLYDDVDLHQNENLFAGYDVVVLGGHAEYWSLAMRQGLSTYLTNGGNLVYAGANGIYEAVDIDPLSGLVTYRFSAADAATASAATGSSVSVGDRRLMTMLGYPGSLLLGVAYRSISNHYPYQVEVASDHPLLAGTGLTTGALFGSNGYNGAASGWEVDAVLMGWPGEATPDQIIASGTNPKGGASMIYMPTQHGGKVFSASSISFVGALATDSRMSRLLSNVFADMLAPAPTTMMSTQARPSAPASPQRMQQTTPSAPTADQLADDH